MKIQKKETKQLNITAVFEKIEHSFITSQKIKEIFDVDEKQLKQSSFFEGPNLKVLIQPVANGKKEIVVEGNKLKIRDDSDSNPEKSSLVKNFKKAFHQLISKKEALIAYGFNYDFLVTTENAVDYNLFMGDKIKKLIEGTKLLRSGISLEYEKDTKINRLRISPSIYHNNQFIFHLNVEFEEKEIPFSALQEQFVESYKESEKIIDNLEI